MNLLNLSKPELEKVLAEWDVKIKENESEITHLRRTALNLKVENRNLWESMRVVRAVMAEREKEKK